MVQGLRVMQEPLNVYLSWALPALCWLVAACSAIIMVRRAPGWSMIDIPNHRSSHRRPTPRGGGIGIAVSITGSVAVLGVLEQISPRDTAALAMGAMVAAAGWVDDLSGLSAPVRLLVQLLGAIASLWLLQGPVGFTGAAVSWWLLAITCVGVVWVTNLFNFMDGIDGLAAAEAMFIGLASWIFVLATGGPGGIAILWLCIAGASAGFLTLNWPPARIFMGDVGSAFLGFIIAIATLLTSRITSMPVEVWLILGGCFLVDATITLLYRMLRGERWYAPHRIHAYQVLSRRLGSHRSVTLIYLAVNCLWLLPWGTCAVLRPELAAYFAAVALLPLVMATLLVGAGRPETINERAS